MSGGSGYEMNFNQDFTSISVLNKTGLRLYSINSVDKIDEIFTKDNEHIRLVERLFNSSLVVMVTEEKPNCLKMLHFKKKQDICNCVYPSEILAVRMNRQRLIVCLAESIHIHDIRDMKILHSIENIAPNELGLCALSLSSHCELAYPISNASGELNIFNAKKLKPGITIKAHDSPLSALTFSSNGQLLATASERGTVIRVFCAKSGERMQEFRRGVKRCVRISSLVFSPNGDFLCATSNTETVHIFKIDQRAVEAAERKQLVKEPTALAKKGNLPPSSNTSPAPVAAKLDSNPIISKNTQQSNDEAMFEGTTAVSGSSSGSGGGSWSGYLSKAVSSYLIPTQVCDVLSQDRAFAMAVLATPGLRHICGLARIEKQLKLLLACEDGFLYVYDFNMEKGGQCKLQRLHDLRYALEGVIELELTDSIDRLTTAANEAPLADFSKEASDKSKPKSKSTLASSVVIENPELKPDNSYAGIVRGEASATLTDSAKFRKLCDAIDTPTTLYDDKQFPPVAIAVMAD